MSVIPFILFGDSGRAIKYWNVEPSGNWTVDCQRGRDYALNLMEHLKVYDRVPIIRSIVSSFPQEWSGLETGFMTQIMECAIIGYETR